MRASGRDRVGDRPEVGKVAGAGLKVKHHRNAGIPQCTDQVFSLRGSRIEGDVVVSDQDEVVGVSTVTK